MIGSYHPAAKSGNPIIISDRFAAGLFNPVIRSDHIATTLDHPVIRLNNPKRGSDRFKVR